MKSTLILAILQGTIFVCAENIILPTDLGHNATNSVPLPAFEDVATYDIKIEMNLLDGNDRAIMKLLHAKPNGCEVLRQGTLPYMLEMVLRQIERLENGDFLRGYKCPKTKHKLLANSEMHTERLSNVEQPLKVLAEMSVNSMKFAEIKMISYDERVWQMAN